MGIGMDMGHDAMDMVATAQYHTNVLFPYDATCERGRRRASIEGGEAHK